MANEEHLKILHKGVEAWNKSRDENPAMKADLEDANLEEADLEDANLEGTDLRKANLWEADLRGANLKGANLRTATLMGANLEDARLERANLERAELERANLRGVNLRGANLRSANLERADLRGADLRGAYLGRANLWEANLSRSDLGEAKLGETNLEGSDLGGTNLRGANLRAANLRGANLRDADLGGANLEDAVLGWTFFFRSDLAEVKKLQTCKHQGPSNIDHETIVKSGSLPIEFLRGCGLSDWQTEAARLNLPDLTPGRITEIIYRIYRLRSLNPVQYYSCFISYSRADKSFASRLYDKLQESGIRVWLDEHPMLAGDDTYEMADYGIRLWDKILFCCSKHSLTSWWVENEMDRAFKNEGRLMKKHRKKVLTFIPLDLDGYMFAGWTSLQKSQVYTRPVADFKGWDKAGFDFDNKSEKIIKMLQVDSE